MDDMMKSRDLLVNKTLEAKMMMMEKNSQEKQARWELHQEDEKLKDARNEKRASQGEACHGRAQRRGENTKMMDPSLWMNSQKNGGV
jgi:hypothetical protein